MDPNTSTSVTQPQSNQSPISQPPIPENSMPKQRGFLLPLIGILVFIVIAGGVYYFVKGKPPNLSETQKLTPTAQPTSTAEDPTANRKTFNSTLGGFTLKYPADWIAQGFEGYKESFSPNSNIVRFYSKQPQRNFSGNYMCVELRIGSNDNYPLKNGELLTGGNVNTQPKGLEIFQEKASSTSKDYYILHLTETDKKMSLVGLPNGNKLAATAEYNCIQGDLDNLNLDLDQQANSYESIQAQLILRSIQYQQSNQASNICTQDIQPISVVIDSFEGQQRLRHADWVLNMFTLPQMQAEINDFNNLSGKDANISSRLYNNVSTNFNTNSYKVLTSPTKYGDATCSVTVQEERSYYGGPANPQYLPTTTAGFTFILTKLDGSWKIDKYQKQTGKNSGESDKYSGWF